MLCMMTHPIHFNRNTLVKIVSLRLRSLEDDPRQDRPEFVALDEQIVLNDSRLKTKGVSAQSRLSKISETQRKSGVFIFWNTVYCILIYSNTILMYFLKTN